MVLWALVRSLEFVLGKVKGNHWRALKGGRTRSSLCCKKIIWLLWREWTVKELERKQRNHSGNAHCLNQTHSIGLVRHPCHHLKIQGMVQGKGHCRTALQPDSHPFLMLYKLRSSSVISLGSVVWTQEDSPKDRHLALRTLLSTASPLKQSE